jgi:hypothetical protein
MSKSQNTSEIKEIPTPEAFWETVPPSIKWIAVLAGILMTLLLSVMGAKSWLEAFVDARVDSRMKDGAFKKEITKDLNRYLVFDANGAITGDPSGLYGDLITSLSVEHKPGKQLNESSREGDAFIVKLKLSRYVAFEPLLRQYNIGPGWVQAQRVSSVDWEFIVASEGKDNFFLQIYP